MSLSRRLSTRSPGKPGIDTHLPPPVVRQTFFPSFWLTILADEGATRTRQRTSEARARRSLSVRVEAIPLGGPLGRFRAPLEARPARLDRRLDTLQGIVRSPG